MLLSRSQAVRIEPRTFRNAFPSLSTQQQKALTDFYELKKAEADRVAGLEAQAWQFEPKDGLRYGQKLWFERATGLLLKARIQNERSEPVEQFTFTDILLGARIDREMVRPSWPPAPPAWQVHETGLGETVAADTGWVVRGAPPGFSRVAEGYRTLRGKRARSRTSSTRTASSPSPYSSSPPRPCTPRDSCSKEASTSSSATSTAMS